MKRLLLILPFILCMQLVCMEQPPAKLTAVQATQALKEKIEVLLINELDQFPNDYTAQEKADWESFSLEYVKSFVKQGADVNVTSESQWPLLSVAARAEFKKLVAFLIESGVDVNASNPYGGPVLLDVSIRGNIDLAEQLIKAGALVDATDSYERTPLMFAIDSGNVDLINLLLHYGADPDKKDAAGRSARDRAQSLPLIVPLFTPNRLQ